MTSICAQANASAIKSNANSAWTDYYLINDHDHYELIFYKNIYLSSVHIKGNFFVCLWNEEHTAFPPWLSYIYYIFVIFIANAIWPCHHHMCRATLSRHFDELMSRWTKSNHGQTKLKRQLRRQSYKSWKIVGGKKGKYIRVKKYVGNKHVNIFENCWRGKNGISFVK